MNSETVKIVERLHRINEALRKAIQHNKLAADRARAERDAALLEVRLMKADREYVPE